MKSIGDYFEKLQDRQDTTQKFQTLMRRVMEDGDVRDFINEHRDVLSREAIERSAAELYEFVLEKEKAATGSGQMVAGHYPKLVLNNKRIEVTYVPTEEFTAQQAEQAVQARIRSVFLPKNLGEATLDEFEPTPGRREALEKVYEFLENYFESPETFHRGLYLSGAFGVGKTFLLGGMAHELSQQGFETTLVHYPTFAVEMKSSIGSGTTNDRIPEFQKAPILILDDIGAESSNSWLRDEVLGVILQYRMQENLPTFFSSNFSMDQLEEEHFRYTQRGEDEPLKAKRLMERIRYLAEEVEVSGTNRRLND